MCYIIINLLLFFKNTFLHYDKHDTIYWSDTQITCFGLGIYVCIMNNKDSMKYLEFQDLLKLSVDCTPQFEKFIECTCEMVFYILL